VSARELITEHLDLWTGAVTKKSSSGRGSSGKVELTGIKKLRELILELAVRGSLVDQDPSDESAQELLERCLRAKADSVELGKLKKARKHAAITSDDTPFGLPQGWVWSRLDDLVRVINGRAYKKHEMLSSGTPLLRVGNLFTSNDWYYSDLELEEDKYIDSGDLIYAWSASFGPFIWDGGRAIYHYHIWKLDLFDGEAVDKRFLYLYLKAITEEIKSSGSGIAMVHMTKAKMEELIVPVPPLEEQHRIVQKVDELMALCDRLEQQTSDQLEAHETLVDTLLGTLTQSESATELADNWARLAAHFDTLFTTEQSIDKLKQTVIELSVRGFLVSTNDDGGEPAEILLNRLRNEKQRLIAIKKAKDNGKIHQKAPKEPPYDIPSSWTWVRFRELIWCYRGHNPPKSEFKTEPQPGYVRFIQITDFKTDANKVFVPQTSRNKMVHKGEIIMAAYRHIGKLSRNMEGAFNVALCKILEFEPMERDFVELLIRTDLVTGELLRASERGHIPSMHSDHLLSLLVPLPPLVQQRKIVKRVAELATLCDRLKERLNQASETRCQLAKTIVEQGLSA
jgi:type I restriction enzyme S subunit